LPPLLVLLLDALVVILFFTLCKKTDAYGVKATSIELLILGALRHIGRKWTFDCFEKANFKEKNS